MSYSVQIVRDPTDCARLWNEFTPNNSLFDLWSFRQAWISGFKYPVHCILLKKNGTHAGLLPLWFNEQKKIYEWVGGEWPEDNTFFVKNAEDLPILLQNAPSPMTLNALIPYDGINDLSQQGQIAADECLKYIKDLTPYSGMDQLLSGFGKKNKQKLMKDFSAIMEFNPQIVFEDTDNPDYFDYFLELKSLKFNKYGREENFFDTQEFKETFRTIIAQKREYRVRTLTISVQNKRAGVDIVIIYNGRYYLIGGSYDTGRFSGVGNAALYLLFKDAFDQKCTLVDCLQEDSGWKHRYFDGTELYYFEKK